MFSRYIIHLKNVIFFKFIIYFALILSLLYLLPVFNKSLEGEIIKNEKAALNLSESTLKLYSVINAGSGVLDIYKKYETLFNKGSLDVCSTKSDLINKIRLVELKHNLADNIKIAITHPSLENKNQFNSIKINNYDIKLKFKARTFEDFVKIAKDLYSIMPENSVILRLNAKYKKVLDAEIINNLSPQAWQNLIFANLHIRIRELSVK